MGWAPSAKTRSPGIAWEENVCGLAKTPKEEKVNKKIFLILSVYFFFTGCAILETSLQKEQKYGERNTGYQTILCIPDGAIEG